MTALRQRMIEDMQLRGYAVRTQQAYVNAVHQLAGHFRRSPDTVTEQDLRQYFLHLTNVKHREGKRVALDDFETLTKRLKELVTKVVTSFSVPHENTLDVRLRCGREAEDHFLRAKESRTCDQGRAA